MTAEASHEDAPRLPRRGPSRRNPGLPIGEVDANIFNCPTCARPLAVGTKRCPNCQQRLVAGIKVSKAAGFGSIGMSIGMLAGVAGLTIAGLLGQPAAATGALPSAIASSPPVASAPVATPAPSVAVPGVPPAAVSALRQSTIVNQRIVADAARLEQILAIKWPTGRDIAPVLRSMAATAGSGDLVAPTIGTWAEGAALSQTLVTFYAAIGGAADDGLAASMSNSRAYVDAGRRMMSIVSGITEIDAAARALALEAELDLPPLASPPPEPTS